MHSNIFIVGFTGVWYFASSINAVATQKLFEELRDSPSERAELDVLSVAMLLTVAQLFVGGIASFALLLFLTGLETQPADMCGPPMQRSEMKPSGSKISRVWDFFRGMEGLDLVIGLLHCIGSICTNIGFGFGNVSLVQVIKLPKRFC